MNRSTAFLYLLFLLVSQRLSGQETPGPVPGTTPVFASDTNELRIQRQLVELALKSPSYSASNHQNKINELELKKAKGNWLNLLSISTNYNDQTFAKQNVNSPIVYPKYFFGLTIPLGVIFSQGTLVKSAKEAVAFSKDQQAQLARGIKSEVLTKYNQYKLLNQLLILQIELANDISAQLSTTQEKFRKGTITIDVYLTALKTNNEETSKGLQLKSQQEQVKLEIEELIGIPLEAVLQNTSEVQAALNQSSVK
jgi:outer membrane protein TolC